MRVSLARRMAKDEDAQRVNGRRRSIRRREPQPYHKQEDRRNRPQQPALERFGRGHRIGEVARRERPGHESEDHEPADVNPYVDAADGEQAKRVAEHGVLGTVDARPTAGLGSGRLVSDGRHDEQAWPSDDRSAT